MRMLCWHKHSGSAAIAGKLNELHTQPMPGKKAMVVISNGKSMKETGMLYRVLKELAHVGVEEVMCCSVRFGRGRISCPPETEAWLR